MAYHSKTGREKRKMDNTKDQYIGAEIHSARSVNPDGETVTLDDGKKRTAERVCHFGIRVLLYIKGTTATQGGLTKIS